MCLSTVTCPRKKKGVFFNLEGTLHDLEDVGGILLQQLDFRDGEILFKFLEETDKQNKKHLGFEVILPVSRLEGT